jgi:UDPglucose 6-dehydrogenase
LKPTMRGAALVDLRNVFQPAEAEEAGLTYSSIGRG